MLVHCIGSRMLLAKGKPPSQILVYLVPTYQFPGRNASLKSEASLRSSDTLNVADWSETIVKNHELVAIGK